VILPKFNLNLLVGEAENFFKSMLTEVIHERRANPQVIQHAKNLFCIGINTSVTENRGYAATDAKCTQR